MPLSRAIYALLLVPVLASAQWSDQAPLSWRVDAAIQARWEASRKDLRESTLKLRDVRVMSCRRGNTRDCELAALTDVELTLQDIQTKYARASRSTSSERTRKAAEAADQASGSVSDLIDVLNAE